MGHDPEYLPIEVCEFEGRMRELAEQFPAMQVGHALTFIDKAISGEEVELHMPLSVEHYSNMVFMADWAEKQASVMQYLPHKMINAIKELRVRTGEVTGHAMGLYDAKYAIEEVKSRMQAAGTWQ